MDVLQSIYNKLALARSNQGVTITDPNKKVMIATAADRDSAEALAISIREEIEFNDHIITGKLLDSVSVSRSSGDKDMPFAVKVKGYGVFVNGRSGFIDDAVSATILDNYEVESLI